MKKLLVLAALSAMAMGAKADYSYTFDLPGAQAVYAIAGAPAGYPVESAEVMSGLWTDSIKPMLFNEEGPKEYGGVEGFYSTIEQLAEAGQLLQKFQGSDGSFSFDWMVQYENWSLLVLTDAEAISPGAAYSVYWGQGDSEGGPITIRGNAYESGTLMTDASAVPEPTSGLLLLLGVAGLALKRKRA